MPRSRRRATKRTRYSRTRSSVHDPNRRSAGVVRLRRFRVLRARGLSGCRDPEPRLRALLQLAFEDPYALLSLLQLGALLVHDIGRRLVGEARPCQEGSRALQKLLRFGELVLEPSALTLLVALHDKPYLDPV